MCYTLLGKKLPVSTNRENIFTIGDRFREERKRLDLSQESLATQIFTSGRTVKNYESGESSPKASELARIAELGGDVLYIVTGERQPEGVREPAAIYSPAEHLAKIIEKLALTEDDAALLESVAVRLSGKAGR